MYWSKVDNATGYRVYRKAVGSAGSWTGLANVSESTSGYTDKTAKSGTQYYYTVRAFNDSTNTTVWSGYKTGFYTLKTPTVSVPQSISDTAIKWSKVDGATGYKIYRHAVGASWSAITTVGANTTSYTDKSAKGKGYYYTVRAIRDMGGKTAYSWYISGEFALRTPTIKNVNTTAATSNKVYWTKVSDCTGYRIYRKTPGASSWTGLANVSSSYSDYTDKTAKSNTQYIYTVRAYRTINSKTFWGGYTGGMKTLEIPKLLGVGDDTYTASACTYVYYQQVDDCTSYRLYYKEPGKSWVYCPMSSNNWMPFCVGCFDNMPAGTSFTIRAVRNKNGINAMSWYNTSGVKETPKTNVLGVDCVAANKNKVTWSKISGVSGYQVCYYDANIHDYKLVADVPASQTSVTVAATGSHRCTTYMVKPYISAGKYKIKNREFGKKMANLATPMHAYYPEYNSKEQFTGNTIWWYTVSDAQSYRVYRCEDGGSWKALANVSTCNYYTDKTAKENIYYHYTVRAVRKTNGIEQKSWFCNRNISLNTVLERTSNSCNAWGLNEIDIDDFSDDEQVELIYLTISDYWISDVDLIDSVNTSIRDYSKTLNKKSDKRVAVWSFKSKSCNEFTLGLLVPANR